MSYTIIEALFDGKIIPWERRVSHSLERREIEEKIDQERGYFTEKMSSGDGEKFRDLEELYRSVTYDEELNLYAAGFTLGALLMLEVLEKKGDVINA